MSRFLLGVSAIALLMPAAARAEVLDLAPITVYGNVGSLPLSRTGATVSIIDAEELEDAPSENLAETLAQIPGVTYSQNGPTGQTGFVRLRGLPQRYAPVLLNGINISDPTGVQTQFDFGNILQGGLGSVEIVKGAQSALYGSDAVAGVIALTGATAPRDPGRFLTLGAEYGSFDTLRTQIEAGFATERVGVAFSVATLDASGPSAIARGGNVSLFDPVTFASASPEYDYDEDDAVSGRQFTFDAYVDATDTIRLGLTGFGQRFLSDYDQGFADYDSVTGAVLTDPETGDTETDQRGLRAYAEIEALGLFHTIEASRFEIDRASTNTFGTNDFDGSRTDFGYVGEWAFGSGSILSFGLDRKTEEADAAPDDVTVTGYFGEVVYAARPDLDLSLSLRRDDHSEFGEFVAARAAATWRARPDLTFRASVANGYRAPSLYELFDPTYGNASLDPEESITADLGVEKTFDNGAALTATLFYAEIEELIAFDFVAGYQQSNGISVSRGVELSGLYPVSDRLTLTGAFTYTDAREADDDPQVNVPRYDLSLGVQADITDRLSGGMTLRHVADLPPASNAAFGTETLDDYTVVNAQASYAIRDGIEAYLRVENLFDTDYEILPDYEAPDRSAYFGIRASF
ncbi:TonB-dependent receptor plug domain-containing protein [Roseivivax sp. CAU 1753]